MNKTVKNVLLIFFVVLFVILTTVASLYASGYKFNLSWPLRFNRLLQKTGALNINTKPVNAVVYLNGKKLKTDPLNLFSGEYIQTPAKIKNLLPGEYDLRLEADGYWPYVQKIWINSGQATFLKDINLFLDNLPALIRTAPTGNLNLSPNGRYLYSAADGQIMNLKTGESRQATIASSSIWLDNSRLLVGGRIFNPVDSSKDANYENSVGNSVSNWCFDDNDGLIYYQTAQAISCVKASDKSGKTVISGGDYIGYFPLNGEIFVLSRSGSQIALSSYASDGTLNPGSYLLPANGDYAFIGEIDSRIEIYDRKNLTAYLFNPDRIGDGPLAIRGAKDLKVFDDNSLIYTNGWEIYTIDINTGQTSLITRLSGEIDNLIWNSKKNYLVLTDKDSVKIFNFKNSSLTELFRGEQLISPVIDETGDNLYFWAKVGQQSGIYKMRLQ